MGECKKILVQPIKCDVARDFVREHHYSGSVCCNSQLHLGAFLDGRLGGVMQFGPSLDKRKIQALVADTPWNGFLELNRMAFSDYLPRNSESRCIAVAMRMIRKNYPWIKWIVSFADGCQCGDGTIYRASGFVLTQIKRCGGGATGFYRLPGGESFCDVTIEMHGYAGRITKYCTRALYDQIVGGNRNNKKRRAELMDAIGAVRLTGFSLRYIYFLDPAYREKLKCPVLPFSAIADAGAKMYKGKREQEQKLNDHAPEV